MNSFNIIPFDIEKTEEIIEFSRRNPWKPIWTPELMREFLLNLTSSEELVFDLHSNAGRVAVGVLVDKINNPGNDACLEILGLKKEADFKSIYQEIITLAKFRLASNRSGVELTIHQDSIFPADFLSSNRLVPYYETFEMLHNDIQSVSRVDSASISPLNESEHSELYQVLTRSFSNSPDTSIPAFEDWKAAQNKAKKTPIWTYRKEQRIVGFINLLFSEQNHYSEIRTVGVLPEFQGKGIGRILLSYGLNHLCSLSFQTCHLTVAVKNRGALHLYQNLGFRPINHYFVYRWNRAD